MTPRACALAASLVALLGACDQFARVGFVGGRPSGPVADAGSYAGHLTNSTGIPVSSAANVTNTAIMPSYMDTTGQMLNKGYDISNVPYNPQSIPTSPYDTTAQTVSAPDYMRTMKTPIQVK